MKYTKRFKSLTNAVNDEYLLSPNVTTVEDKKLLMINCGNDEEIEISGETLETLKIYLKNPMPENNQIIYRTTLNEAVAPANNSLLGENDEALTVISNEFDETLQCWKMTLSGDLIKIGNDAFYKTCGFTYVALPDSLTEIKYRAFRQCTNKWCVFKFGKNVRTIGDQSFHALNLKNFEFPEGITYCDNAFMYCGFLNDKTKTLVIPGTLRVVGNTNNAMFFNFWGGSNVGKPLDTIIFEEGIEETYKTFACGEDGCTIVTVQLPSTLKILGIATFQYCIELETVGTLPEGLTSIGDYAFCYCEKLTSINIPSTVNSIEKSAFQCCYELETAGTLPEGLTSIGDYAFTYCKKLTSINIPSTVTSIGKTAFNRCEKLTSINIPSTITSIGEAVFQCCYELKTVGTLPEGLTSIGDYAFNYCEKLTSINIPSTVTSIGKAAIQCCYELKTVGTLPEDLTSIGNYAFYHCEKLTSINIPSNVTSICYGAIACCYELETVGTLLDGLTSIGDYAFYECKKLKSINIPSTVTSIGEGTFQFCSSLSSIVIPDSVTSLPSNYFINGCYNLQSLSVDINNTKYDSRNNCNGIIETATNKLIIGATDITEIPEGVTTIGYACMSTGDAGIPTTRESLTIPSTVTSIEKWAFECMEALKYVTCKATIPPTLNALAFEGSNLIEHIYVPAESVEAYKSATNWAAYANIIEAISE